MEPAASPLEAPHGLLARASRALGLALLALVLWQGGLGAWRAQRWETGGWVEAVTWTDAERLSATVRQGKRQDAYAGEVLRLRERILADSTRDTPFLCRPMPAPIGRTVYDQLAILIYPRPTAYWDGGDDPSAAREHALYLTLRDAPREPWMERARPVLDTEHFTLWERGAAR